MKVKIRAFGELIEALGHENVIELEEGTTIEYLLLILAKKSGGLKENFLREYHDDQPNMAILLNGLNIQLLNKTKTIVKDGDTVSLLPPAAGG